MRIFEIAVVEHDTERTVHRLHASSQREAERIERGVNRNLDHANYYTEIRAPLTSQES